MSVGLKVADPLPNKKNKYIAPIFANSIFHCLLIKEGGKKVIDIQIQIRH
jgi:hypothetical protein